MQKKGPVRTNDQRSLAEFARGRTKEVDPYEDMVGTGQTQLDYFLEWLQGLEGNGGSEPEAIQIAVDVSKPLR